MEAMLIVNPSSGGAQAQAYREKVVRAMQQHYQNVYVRLTEGEGDATCTLLSCPPAIRGRTPGCVRCMT